MARRNKTGNQDNQPSDINMAERVKLALELRRLGYDYDAIARQCGYADRSGAFRAVQNAQKRILRDSAQALVQVQLDQINAALVVVNEAIAKNDKGSLWAIDRLVPLLKRQADLLGLDVKPDKDQSAEPTRRVYEIVRREP
jgi:anion-transporting  ArsA/GET3 family ATPase